MLHKNKAPVNCYCCKQQQICIASKNASEFIMSCLTLKMVYYVRFVASIFHLFEKVRQAMQQQHRLRSCNGGEKLKEFTMGHISSLLDSIHVFLLLLLHTLWPCC